MTLFSQTVINERLADRFGRDLSGQPIYRVVWSLDQVEKRSGYFEDYVPGTNILIRRVQEIREVKKYAYLDPQWVLEKLMVNINNPEIALGMTYEPFWAFGFEVHGLPKLPEWRAVEYLIRLNQEAIPLTPSQLNEAEEAEAEQEYQALVELMNASIRNDPLHSAVRDGDAVMLNQDGKH